MKRAVIAAVVLASLIAPAAQAAGGHDPALKRNHHSIALHKVTHKVPAQEQPFGPYKAFSEL